MKAAASWEVWKSQAIGIHRAVSTDKKEKERKVPCRDRRQVRPERERERGAQCGSPDSENMTASKKEEAAQPGISPEFKETFHQMLKENLGTNI